MPSMHVGGKFRISLTYEAPTGVVKGPRTDTYHGRFVALVPNERVVRIDEFETTNSALRGEMKITIELADKDGGTEVVGVHGALPGGVSIGAAAKASKQTLSQWNRSTLHAAIQG
jgi:uncharacterized protein YndB with AHSA1/START domain